HVYSPAPDIVTEWRQANRLRAGRRLPREGAAMQATLVPEMVRRGLQPVRDALHPDRPQYTPEEAGALVAGGVLQAGIVALAKGRHDEALDRGVEGRKMAFLVRLSLDTIQDVLQAFDETLKAVADETPRFERKEELLELLAEARRRVEGVKKEQEALLRILEA